MKTISVKEALKTAENFKYSIRLNWDVESAVWVAACIELPCLLAHGDTPEEALREIKIAMAGFVEVVAEDGPLPEPVYFTDPWPKISAR